MSSTFTKGQILGRYELLLPLARGGMAEVWAARLHGTRGFRKLVAIKTMLPGVIEDDRAELMFMEEAGLACRIQHPNVVEIYELGEEEETLYLAMEWIDGEPLSYIQKQATEENPIPLTVAVNLVGQCCKGLQAAHEVKDDSGKKLGLVHRDISPHNILVTYSGTVKIVDFGIAKVTSENVGLTAAGELKGKLAYMSPEHLTGGEVDQRSDLFALGIVLYQLSTGEHPFRGETPGETVRNTTVLEPKSPADIIPDYPKELERIVLKALEKSPNDRYSSARALLLELQKAVPTALDHTADAETATYLGSLLGARIQSKKTAIRKAVESSQFSGHTGTLQLTATSQSGTMGAVTNDAAEGSSTHNQFTSMLRAQQVATRRYAFLGAAMAVGVTALVGFMTSRAPTVPDGPPWAGPSEPALATAPPSPPEATGRVAPEAVSSAAPKTDSAAEKEAPKAAEPQDKDTATTKRSKSKTTAKSRRASKKYVASASTSPKSTLPKPTSKTKPVVEAEAPATSTQASAPQAPVVVKKPKPTSDDLGGRW